MGKWYSVPNYVRFKKDIEYERSELKDYLPHVITIARGFPQDSIAIGSLTLNDLIQAGNVGLIEAWNMVDHDKSQGEIWSFLKKRIKWSIKREIDKHSQHVAVPINQLENHRNKLKNAYDLKIITNVFPNFFDEELAVAPHNVDPYESILLEELIDDELVRVTDNVDHRDITKKFFGIGFDKMSQKELAEKYRLKQNNIGQIVNRIVKKMNNEQFEKIIENFYGN